MMNDVTIDDIDIAEGDFDDIDSTGDDADIFENVGDRIGKAVLKKRATVLTAFNQFLMRIGYVPNNFDELSTNQLNNFRDVMGQFPDYLMKVRKISNIKSNQNYISCIKEMIISRAPNSDIVQGAWYTRLRTNIEKMYVQAAMDNGTTLYTDSNYTNEHDLATLCRSLITDNTAISISMRSLLCFEWYCHGRINEVAEHLHSSKFDAYFGNGIRCMKGRLLRGKTSREDDILFMIHATDWTICPIHSFASLLACNNITLKLYPFISQSRGSDNVNLLLKRKCREHDSLTPKLTSKCFKTGAATSLNEHPNSKETNIVLRLGHQVKKMQTSYSYILKTTKIESQTARLVSGWNNPLYGGICPWIEAISENERESFQFYAINLIGCHHLTSNLVLMAAVVLVMNYRTVRRQYSQSILIQRMNDHGVTREQLECWCDVLQKEFVRLNARYLPVNAIRDDTSIHAFDMKTFMDKSIKEHEETRVQMFQQNQQMVLLMEQNQQIIQLLQEHASSTSQSSRSTIRRNTLITNHFNRNANSTDRDTAVLAEVSTHFPPELLSRKSLPISDFFLRWYKQELYNINCQSDEESRSFNLFKNAIRLLKRFLPDNSILEKRPISDHTSLRAWLHNLGRLSATIEDRSLAFCEQHKKPNNNPVRQRKLQPFFEGIYKRLNELSFDRRVQFPTPVGVVDRCMPNEMNSTV